MAGEGAEPPFGGNHPGHPPECADRPPRQLCYQRNAQCATVASRTSTGDHTLSLVVRTLSSDTRPHSATSRAAHSQRVS